MRYCAYCNVAYNVFHLTSYSSIYRAREKLQILSGSHNNSASNYLTYQSIQSTEYIIINELVLMHVGSYITQWRLNLLKVWVHNNLARLIYCKKMNSYRQSKILWGQSAPSTSTILPPPTIFLDSIISTHRPHIQNNTIAIYSMYTLNAWIYT